MFIWWLVADIQDRSRAQALADSLQAPPISSPSFLSLAHGPDYNMLTVTVINCRDLPARDPGTGYVCIYYISGSAVALSIITVDMPTRDPGIGYVCIYYISGSQ